MVGSAMPTTVASIDAMAEPSTVASSTHRPGPLAMTSPGCVPLAAAAGWLIAAPPLSGDRSTMAVPCAPRRTWASACAAWSSGKLAPTVTRSTPWPSSPASRASRGPSGSTWTALTVMPRSAGGGSPVMVASRPPGRTARTASAAPARAAFTAASAPPPPPCTRTVSPGQICSAPDSA